MLTKAKLIELINQESKIYQKFLRDFELSNKQDCLSDTCAFISSIKIDLLKEIFHDYYESYHISDKTKIKREITKLKNELNKLNPFDNKRLILIEKISDLEDSICNT